MVASDKFEPGAYRRTFALSVLCAACGGLLGYWITRDSAGEVWDRFGWYAAAAAGLTIAPLWWLIVERRRRFGVVRGALVGAVGGFLVHYPCWYLAALGQYVAFRFFGGSPSSTGEPPMDPVEALGGALVFSLWSWLLVGWLTVIVGAVIVGTYAGYFRRLRR